MENINPVNSHALSLIVDEFIVKMDVAREKMKRIAGSTGSKIAVLSTEAFREYVVAKRGASYLVTLDGQMEDVRC